MRRSRSLSLSTLLGGAVVSLLAGCNPVDLDDGVNTPAPLSERTCYQDSDCTGNACCGRGTNPTHVKDGPDCTNVRCDGQCRPDSIECGRCLVICRDSRCEAACSR